MTVISKRKRIWGWFFFDGASQPYHTLLITFIFGPYFASVAAEYYMNAGLSEQVADARAQTLWSTGLTISGLIIGLGAPIMGAFADTTGRRLPWIIVFSLMYVTGAAAIWGMTPDGANL
jgi:UMF1 family MFS transporter